MAFLLDTNVFSEIRRERPDPNVDRWFASVVDDDVYLSVLVAGEIRQGAERLRRRDPQRAEVYELWLTELLVRYAERTAVIDAEVAEQWGRLNASRPLPVVDGLLAATAIVRGWTLVTRNVRDVAGTGVMCLDPFLPAA
ncbi:MAG TPA: type II toxin-antitoxin system VapC family toxin [Acidimicrobiales bacterium]|nr:type II toxin-antitoxin system VapC family toxin [Acidimicrobiales bacterium]